jgi:hypothetical protein
MNSGTGLNGGKNANVFTFLGQAPDVQFPTAASWIVLHREFYQTHLLETR